MSNIELPANVSIDGVISLLDKLGALNDAEDIVVDFKNLDDYDMVSVVAMLGKFFSWVVRDKSTKIANAEKARNFQYLQLMDFFTVGGITTVEEFTRDSSTNRFVGFKRIGKNGETDTSKLSTQIADCIAPDLSDETDLSKTGFYDCIEYAVSELMNNVIQHSRGGGIVGAQHYAKSGITQIAIADDGIGIKESFERNGSPILSKIDDHADAIYQALLPQISSKTHNVEAWSSESVNAGVGLTLLRSIAQFSGGEFLIVSGDAAYKNNKRFILSPGHNYHGTYVAFTIKRSRADSFDDNLERAKIIHGLMSPADEFSGVFK